MVAVLLVPWLGGCASSRARYWKPAEFARPTRIGAATLDDVSIADHPEAAYERALDLEAANSDVCVDWYFQVAKLLWPTVAQHAENGLSENGLANSGSSSNTWLTDESTDLSEADASRSEQLYRSAVGKLVTAGAAFKRFDSRVGLRVIDVETGEPTTVPVTFRGFAWARDELRDFEVVGDYKPPLPTPPKRKPGLGVPVLIHPNCDRPYVFPEAAVAATVVLHPNTVSRLATLPDTSRIPYTSGEVPWGAGPSEIGSHPEPPVTDSAGAIGAAGPSLAVADRPHSAADDTMVLDILGSASVRTIRVGERSLPIAVDLTAPLAFLQSTTERHWMEGFAHPDQIQAESGLSMIAPYEPGKIPVVFVHGLASDEWTWSAMGNELFWHPDLMHRFQFWAFSYPTGAPFPDEAANLRQQLVDLRKSIDPKHRDEALDNIVLIGHSMGGLVAKMQICRSDDRIVRSIFKKPLRGVEMPDDMRQHFERIAIFEPSPQIRRVVFIGTPHGGSKLASGSVGKLASKLVRFSETQFDRTTEFLTANQDLLVVPILRIPTSIDLLRPDNQVLQAVASLPIDPSVHLHSIIGVGHKGRFGEETGDGVVSVSSARLPNVDSELLVDSGHGLHNDPATFAEVIRILRVHASSHADQ